MTNGKTTYAEQLLEIEAELENYIASLAITPVKISPIQKILESDRGELIRMTASECEQNALLLTQCGMDSQVKYNKLYAVIQWIDSMIDDMITPVVSNYNGYSYEERKKSAILDNSAAKYLHDRKRELVLKKDSMFGLINKLDVMAKFYGEMAKSKKWSK